MGTREALRGGVVGPRRQRTQTISRWAYEHGYNGLAYSSRFDVAPTCCAMFERAMFEVTGSPESILPSDPDLLATAQLFGLRIP